MAIIKCYECGKEISSLAQECVHCGAPRKKSKNKKDVRLTERQKEQIEKIESDRNRVDRVECKKCGKWISTKVSECAYCGYGGKSKSRKTPPKTTALGAEKRDEFDVLKELFSNVQWKRLISQVAIIWVISALLGFLIAWVIKGMFVVAVINILVLISAFTFIHYFTEQNKLQHCVHVVLATWLTSIINMAFGVSFVNFLLLIFWIIFCMCIAIGISKLISASK